MVPQDRWVMEVGTWEVVDNLKTDPLQIWATLKETLLEGKVSDLICLLMLECSQTEWAANLDHRTHLEVVVEHPTLETSLVVVQQTHLHQEHQVASLTIEKLIKAFFHQSM